MMNHLKKLLDYDKILILGFGREGKSTYRIIRSLFPDKTLYIHDAKEVDGADLVNVVLQCGDRYALHLEEYDLVIKTPGIVLSEIQLSTIRNLTSQTELFLNLFAKQTIGITGTKGKSTTSSLLYHILNECVGNTFLVGNIGIPCFDVLDQINETSKIVFEMSCHQLEYTRVSPHISVFLNIFEEHLDHYGTMEAYVSAKQNIIRYQDENDLAFIHESLKSKMNGVVSSVVSVGNNNCDVVIDPASNTIRMYHDQLYIGKEDTQLLGKHNLVNIGFVYAICKQVFGVTDNAFKQALISFRGLPHRLELFSVLDGVRYYDDSISTASETAIQALQSVERVGTLILGGMDRHISYDKLADYLASSYKGYLVLMPDTGIRIHALLQMRMQPDQLTKLHLVKDLAEAVKVAKALTKSGEACVLSPAAASYGFFKDFEDRGNTFQRLVLSNE